MQTGRNARGVNLNLHKRSTGDHEDEHFEEY
jgi:hypothetical protein